MMRIRGRPLVLWLLILLLGQLSGRAVLGGGALLLAPSGTLVGVSTGPLDATPFRTFLVPGLVLLLAFGLLPGLVCYGLHIERWWAWPAGIAVALALLVWIGVEVAIGFTRPTVLLNLGTALGIIGASMHPAVRPDWLGTTT